VTTPLTPENIIIAVIAVAGVAGGDVAVIK